MLGSLLWASSLHNCGEQLVTTFCCCLVGSFCFEISPLKKKANSVPLSAPQRPITTHRTTATPKAGPGVVRKNPGVGNGDDEAAELMQQVGISCVHNRNPLGEGALAALTGELCLCSCGKTCLVCVSQQSS